MTSDQLLRRAECQVCGRMLAPKKDGTSRDHYTHRYPATIDRYDREYCAGSGFRLERWKVRQKLRHHSGDVWLVQEDIGGHYGDYLIVCVSGREKGRESVAHGEYMHRHGWTELPRDLMADLEESFKAVDRER